MLAVVVVDVVLFLFTTAAVAFDAAGADVTLKIAGLLITESLKEATLSTL